MSHSSVPSTLPECLLDARSWAGRFWEPALTELAVQSPGSDQSYQWSGENLPEASRNLKTGKPVFWLVRHTRLVETYFCNHFQNREILRPHFKNNSTENEQRCDKGSPRSSGNVEDVSDSAWGSEWASWRKGHSS